ncbi:uncharacterized protein Z518_11324 [Rhinocladiella mackenziei CBS 650.93]|uniref:Uncharacterized protein n=1 Tax=Rhinocladiella mackenziei CBS 650.93 TaxID=1442369 RepID=A0A0D2I8N9_9EURO|nr:uncharacterized protein Z518_11324 [Rhinocladiella mackenziei CBS 650.93]KIW99585.1 hypothetical protein Z518_11324 [Rhinocladiella mackenziei CBS 650.93]
MQESLKEDPASRWQPQPCTPPNRSFKWFTGLGPRLKGKRILVAGGATGIGRATALRLAEEGATVVVGDFNEDGAKDTVQQIQARTQAKAKSIFFDYSNPSSIKELVHSAVDFLGGLDGLVNVGVLGAKAQELDKDISEMDPEAWSWILNGNLVGYAVAVQAALPHLMASGNGSSIVNTTSGSIWGAMPFMPAYQAAKAGVLSLTTYVAQYYAPKGVRSNRISPGPIPSDAVKTRTPQEWLDGVKETVPLRRWGEPDEIAALYVNGQTWSCCGGKYLRD